MQFIATRSIVAAYALWIVLSRPMLWKVTTWSEPIIPKRYHELLIRFGLFFLSPDVEHVLYRLLAVMLGLVLFGIAVRFTALAAGLLLYHFAPLEEFFAGIFSNGHSGFAFAVLSLLAVSFVRTTDRQPSEEYRWPVALIQVLVALQYLLGGLAKVRFSGIAWYTGPNIAATADEMATLTAAPWAHYVAQNAALAWSLAAATFALEFLFSLVLFSRMARRVLIPVALIAQVLRTRIYGLYFMAWPLLAIFINWDWVVERLRIASTAVNTGKAAVPEE
ncbi:MAG TPA: hypothetical protein VLV78_15750 [Thermoanaerobaculia bacterium]|nr:hypothetical protein [Thermoanaerobaculia bacterium]